MSEHGQGLAANADTISSTHEPITHVAPEIIKLLKVGSRSNNGNIKSLHLLILAYNQDRGSKLMVSKRCCPSCDYLASILKRRAFSSSEYPPIYPGSHVHWSPVSLPPWTPASLGDKLIGRAAGALRIRFIRLKNLLDDRVNVRKRSYSVASDVPTEESNQKRPRLSQIAGADEMIEVEGQEAKEVEEVGEGDNKEDSDTDFDVEF